MGRRPAAAEQILRELVSTPSKDRYGLELIRATGLTSGSLYPALMLLEERGWVESHWEQAEPKVEGRPRRRLYKLTSAGRIATAQLAYNGRPAWFGSGLPALPDGIL